MNVLPNSFRLPWIALVSLLAACSSGGSSHDGGTGNDATTGIDADTALSCAWLEGPNCWKATTAMATGCLPPGTESGTLSADGATCAYASGIRVAFTPPIVLPTSNSLVWNFTVTGANGMACLHFEETASGAFKLVVGGQTVDEGTTTGTDLTVTCPDGVKYTAPTALDLIGCPMGLDGLPGIAWATSDTALSVTLVGASGGSLPLFDCRKP